MLIQLNSKMEKIFKLYIVISIFGLSDIHCMRTPRFFTTKDYGYMYLNEYGISTSGLTFITFQVQACSDVHIALKSHMKEQPIEIALGGLRNTRSCIRLTPRGNCLVTNLGSVLDCKEYRSFTVYWGDRQILVEKGNTTAEKSNIFLSLPLNHNLHNVNVGISTGFGSSGRWIIEDIHCTRTTRISTTRKYRYRYLDEYGISTSGSNFISFQVQACSDAHIALKSQMKEQPIEIVIGGCRNKRSCIRLTPQGNCLATNRVAVLNCNEYRSFTVYWGNGKIVVRKGNTTARKSSIFLSLPLNYNLDDVNVGISTGFGSSGRWIIEDTYC